jgi:hypothetical protein
MADVAIDGAGAGGGPAIISGPAGASVADVAGIVSETDGGGIELEAG